MRYPLDSLQVTQPFGVNPENYAQFGLKGHEGVDLKTRFGKPSISFWNDLMGWRPVYAVCNGVVIVLYDLKKYGTHIYLTDAQGNRYLYAHLKNARCATGQTVKEGDIIAVSDNSGNTTGAHLHFGYRPVGFDVNNGYGGFVDPMVLFNQPVVPVTIKIARIGTNLLPFSDLQAKVAHFTQNRITLVSNDYSFPQSVPNGLLTQDEAYGLLTAHPEVKESFVQIYYSSPSAPFLASYSFPNLGKYISTLPNNPPANLIAYELANSLVAYCNDVLHAAIQVVDSNFPDDAFITRKYATVLPFLKGGEMI